MSNISGTVPANAHIQKWVKDMAAMCQPDNVYWCDGSEDERERLTDFIRDALKRSDIMIVTGGLGPTEDDLTREAVADALHRSLGLDETILERLRQRFEKYGFKMTENNQRQALVIEGAVVLENRRGSAPGQYLEVGDKTVVLGLISSKTGELEARDMVLRRIEDAANYIPIGRLALSPQCGFASSGLGNPLSEEEQWKKLELVASIAHEVWR